MNQNLIVLILLMISPFIVCRSKPMKSVIPSADASKVKTILCYGDSLMWGFIPGSYDKQTCLGKRYPKNIRLAGILQNDNNVSTDIAHPIKLLNIL